MLFNSYIFILFFLPVTLLLYCVLNKYEKYTAAKVALTVMSLWFYAYFNLSYLFIIIGSILFNYFISKLINSEKYSKRATKLLLAFGILANISLIFYFKYLNFCLESINYIFHAEMPIFSILMPLGISFFTFQQVSYLVDSYHGETKEYGFIDYALFVTFFPQLVAGPIVLHDEMIPQFNDKNRKRLDETMFAKGIYLFAIGLFKKVLLADTLALGVNWGYNNIELMSGLDTLLVSLMYAVQIYFDFSGYCDIAIGVSNMFHIDLPLNFNSPYKAASIIEFWQRWHMSLSRFLRRYVYIPLGGSKKGNARTILNTFIVFLVSGIWHGANWTYILWGITHGIANVLNRLFKNIWECIPKFIRCFSTFAFCIVTLIIFRSPSLTDCWKMYDRLFCGWQDGLSINTALTQCFDVIELTYIEEHVGFLTTLTTKIPSLNMWIILAISYFIVFCTKNCHEKEFKPKLSNAIFCVVLLVWSIISLSGLSTFLYFNF